MLTTEQKLAWQADATRGNALLVWNCSENGMELFIVSGDMLELAKNANNVYVNAAYDDDSDEASREHYADELAEKLSDLRIQYNTPGIYENENEQIFILDYTKPAAFDMVYHSGFFP